MKKTANSTRTDEEQIEKMPVNDYGLCWHCQSNLDAEGYCDQCELCMGTEPPDIDLEKYQK